VFYDYFLTVKKEILGPLSALHFLYFGVDFFYIVHTFVDVVDRFQMQSAIFSDLPENRSAAQTANTRAIRAV
jgi:hypothetical protein